MPSITVTHKDILGLGQRTNYEGSNLSYRINSDGSLTVGGFYDAYGNSATAVFARKIWIHVTTRTKA
jgi:hypothetical protein